MRCVKCYNKYMLSDKESGKFIAIEQVGVKRWQITGLDLSDKKFVKRWYITSLDESNEIGIKRW